jgi:hypothetical protein
LINVSPSTSFAEYDFIGVSELIDVTPWHLTADKRGIKGP